MTSVTDNQKIPAGKSKSFLFSGSVTLAAATILFLSAMGWFGHSLIKEEMRQAITEQLVAALGANAEALSIWIEQKRSDVKVWAADRDVINDVSALLELAESAGLSREVLLNSKELDRLRQKLGPVCNQYGYVGFILFDFDGNQI